MSKKYNEVDDYTKMLQGKNDKIAMLEGEKKALSEVASFLTYQ